MEEISATQDKQNISYKIICNEPIHINIPKKQIPLKFEIPKIEPFKGKEDPKEYVIRFKYSSYFISSDDSLMLCIFTMILAEQEMDWYNNRLEHSIKTYS